MYCERGALLADCGETTVLRVLSCELEGKLFSAAQFAERYGERKPSLS
jgi:hypothetical protein